MNDASIKIALQFIDQATAPMRSSLSQIQKQTASVERAMQSASRAVKTFFAGYALYKGADLAKGLLETASTFDMMKISLDTITKGKGEETFKMLNEWAMKMPVNTEAAVQGYISLRARGLEPTIAQMTTLVDTSTALGGGKERFTGIIKALGDIQSKGKMAAQELNQLAEWGVPARQILADAFGITTQKLEELSAKGISAKSALEALWRGMEQQFGGQSSKIMAKFSGLTESIESYWKEFQRQLMDSGPMKQVESDLAGIVTAMDDLKARGRLDEWANQVGAALQDFIKNLGITGDNLDETGQKFVDFITATTKAASGITATVVPALKDLTWAMGELFAAYNQFPDEVKGAAGTGILVRLLTGSWTLGAAVTALKVGAQGLHELAEGVRALDKSESAIDARMKAAAEAYKGISNIIREPIPAPGVSTPEIIIPELMKETKAPKAKAIPSPIDLSDIDKQIMSAQKSIMDSFRTITDASYDMNIAMAEHAGNYYLAEEMRQRQWVEKSKSGFQQRIESEEQAYLELSQRLSGSKGGATPEAVAALDTLKKSVEALKAELPSYNALIDEMAANQTRWADESRKLTGALDLAQVNLEYAELTGNMQGQLQAQLALIKATRAQKMANVDLNIPGLADAYRKLYDEQARVASALGGNNFWAGFRQGLSDTSGGLQTLGQLGSAVAKDLKAGFADVFKGFITGADDMETRFANMLESLGDKLMEFAMSAAWDMLSKNMQGGSGGGGWFSMFGSLFSSGSGSGMSGNADGGPVYRGVPTIVGERGREIFTPPSFGMIIPNHVIANMSNGGSNRAGNANVNLPTPEINVYSPGPNTRVTMKWRESSGQQRARAARTLQKAQRDI
ncbi:MAG: tape measure protein [Pseudomonadota bacterium]